jgi:hypothetical protein
VVTRSVGVAPGVAASCGRGMRLGLANSLEPEAGDGPPRVEEAAVVVLVVDEGDVEAPHV